LASRINLHLAKNATLLISDDLNNYPSTQNRYQDSITANNAQDLEISGEGVIDIILDQRGQISYEIGLPQRTSIQSVVGNWSTSF
jgi:polygalacturonase